MLAGLTDKLRAPEAAAEAMRAYVEETNRLNRERRASGATDRKELAEIEKKIRAMGAVIEDGGYARGMMDRLRELEARQDELNERRAAVPADIPDIPPNIAIVYRRKVERLAEALADPRDRDEAAEAIRRPAPPLTDRPFLFRVARGVARRAALPDPAPMSTGAGNRTARVRTPLSKRTAEALEPADKSRIAWDDRPPGFGGRLSLRHQGLHRQPPCRHRRQEGPNTRVVIGRDGQRSPDQARRDAPKRSPCRPLGTPSRTTWRSVPIVPAAPTGCLAQRRPPVWPTGGPVPWPPSRAGPSRTGATGSRPNTNGRWRIGRGRGCGPSPAGPASITKSCTTRVDLWVAGGGRFHRKVRCEISAPPEVLPCWRVGIEAEVHNPTIRATL